MLVVVVVDAGVGVAAVELVALAKVEVGMIDSDVGNALRCGGVSGRTGHDTKRCRKTSC